MKSYQWSWVGKMRVNGLFGEKFEVVLRSEADAIRRIYERVPAPAPKITVPAGVEKRLLRDIDGLNGRYMVSFTKLEDGTVITTAALKLEDGYYMGLARESRPSEFCEGRAKIVALGRALKAATKGWVGPDDEPTNELLDERLGRIAGPVECSELPDYLLQKEDRVPH